MSDSGSPQEGSDVGGLGGPVRRLRAMTNRERVVTVSAGLVSALVAGAIYWALARVFGDDPGWFGFVFFAFWMFVVSQYQPELVKLFRRMND